MRDGGAKSAVQIAGQGGPRGVRERFHLSDTTRRDGQQTQGVPFSLAERRLIAAMLDTLGVDAIEGGWPGANPTDSAVFDAPPERRATLTTFGMTRRVGRSAGNDDVLAAVLNPGTRAVCLVDKTHPFPVRTALGVALEEIRTAIADSLAHGVAQAREALFDAAHFFDGYADDPACALSCLHAALDAGARQVQGTFNGLGERCGNVYIATPIPTLLLKQPYADRFESGATAEGLPRLLTVSRRLGDILNRVPRCEAPYGGASAFAQKAGLHASAILTDPTTHEHVPPGAVSHARVVPMSNQAGLSLLRRRLAQLGLDGTEAQMRTILERVKAREDEGHAYDTAAASFKFAARAALGRLPSFFEVERYRVTVERRGGAVLSEGVVVLRVNGETRLSVSESRDADGSDRGPVTALSQALAKDLGPLQDRIADMALVDVRVRIMQGVTEAVTRVVIDHEDGAGRRWSTAGVSPNVVDASFGTLLDAVLWKPCLAA